MEKNIWYCRGNRKYNKDEMLKEDKMLIKEHLNLLSHATGSYNAVTQVVHLFCRQNGYESTCSQ